MTFPGCIPVAFFGKMGWFINKRLKDLKDTGYQRFDRGRINRFLHIMMQALNASRCDMSHDSTHILHVCWCSGLTLHTPDWRLVNTYASRRNSILSWAWNGWCHQGFVRPYLHLFWKYKENPYYSEKVDWRFKQWLFITLSGQKYNLIQSISFIGPVYWA